jgi:hypothetical protein
MYVMSALVSLICGIMRTLYGIGQADRTQVHEAVVELGRPHPSRQSPDS